MDVIVNKKTGRKVHLVEGNLYRIGTLTPPQRLVRRHQLTYLGRSFAGLTFNARPYAGTQVIDDRTIEYIVRVGPSRGSEDRRHYMNEIER